MKIHWKYNENSMRIARWQFKTLIPHRRMPTFLKVLLLTVHLLTRPGAIWTAGFCTCHIYNISPVTFFTRPEAIWTLAGFCSSAASPGLGSGWSSSPSNPNSNHALWHALLHETCYSTFVCLVRIGTIKLLSAVTESFGCCTIWKNIPECFFEPKKTCFELW